ncbi:MAG: hypothetical protein FWD15_03190 [Alphaproteobacteria bacterium]|nr:hypothetical protein [Alphaproteobacteria bacterium]
MSNHANILMPSDVPAINPPSANDCKFANGTATGMISTCPRKAAENAIKVSLSREDAEYNQDKTNKLLDYVCLACRDRRNTR